MSNKIKENKKVMMIKMDQANRTVDKVVEEFISILKPLVKTFLQADNEPIESKDKLAIIKVYVETYDDIGGITIIGIRK